MSGSESRRGMLVTDFDGTLTETDFYKIFRDRYLGGDASDFWAQYRLGRITHLEALSRIFAAAAPGDEALRSITRAMNLESRLADRLERLSEAGWSVCVVSAGCRWYIDLLLEAAGVSLPVHANPGRIAENRLQMWADSSAEFYCPQNGVDKPAVVRAALARYDRVAFSGDGVPDCEAALLVEPDLRFARGDLAAELGSRSAVYREFGRWSDVADALLGAS